jgi:glutaredoxin
MRSAAIVIALVLGAATTAQGAPAAPTLEVFVKSGCSHCDRARRWLDDFRARRPEVPIIVHDVAASPDARARLRALAEGRDVVAAVPAFVVADHLLVGFDTPASTEAKLAAWLTSGSEIADAVGLPWGGRVRVRDVGLPVFTAVVGLLDGFNPCAMWVLLFLLSLLVNVHDRRRMALIGGTFVVISGVAYYLFMSAWLGLFMLVGASRWLQAGLGLLAMAIGAIHVKDAATPGRGPSLSIPASAKPGIYARVRRIVRAEDLRGALVATIALAATVNLIELLCTAGLPALYTQILTAQELRVWQYQLYLALYIVAYMFDDALMLTIAIVTLSRHKLQERGGRALQLLSGAIMLLLGGLLLVRPDLLSFR